MNQDIVLDPETAPFETMTGLSPRVFNWATYRWEWRRVEHVLVFQVLTPKEAEP